MRSFFAMSWDESDPVASGFAAAISDEIRRSGVTRDRINVTTGLLFCDLSEPFGATVINIQNDRNECRGFIYGDLFSTIIDGGYYNHVSLLSSQESLSIIDTDGLTLIDEYWGSYLCLIKTGQTLTTLTDPTSSIPCYYTQRNGVTLLFSHFERCAFLTALRFSINHEFLQQFLVYDKIQTGDTGLHGVSELLGGQRLKIVEDQHSIETVWDPRSLALNPLQLSNQEAADRLREITQAVVRTWARRFNSVTVKLSGGLDSSIVIGCLARSAIPIEVNAVHHLLVSDDPSEELYARSAADLAAREIVITRTMSNLPPRGVDQHPLSVRPGRAFHTPDLSDIMGEGFQNVGEALFSGQGGDHLFFGLRSPYPVVDYIINHRDLGRSFSEVWNSAILSGMSVPRVMATTFWCLLGRSPSSMFLENFRDRAASFGAGNNALADNISSKFPEWLINANGLGPAKFQQINLIYHMIQFRECFDRTGGRRTLHPLISQPLIEYCLKIPVYQLCLEGRSRALARMAFKDVIPEAVRDRMTKGTASRFFSDSLSSQLKMVAETLLNGHLAQENVVERADLDRLVNECAVRMGSAHRQVMLIYCVEAWYRRWKAHSDPSVHHRL